MPAGRYSAERGPGGELYRTWPISTDFGSDSARNSGELGRICTGFDQIWGDFDRTLSISRAFGTWSELVRPGPRSGTFDQLRSDSARFGHQTAEFQNSPQHVSGNSFGAPGEYSGKSIAHVSLRDTRHARGYLFSASLAHGSKGRDKGRSGGEISPVAGVGEARSVRSACESSSR